MAKADNTHTKIAQLMNYYGTDSPTQLTKLLKIEYGIDITKQTAGKHVKNIKEEAQKFSFMVMDSLYSTNMYEEYVMVNKLIKAQDAIAELSPEEAGERQEQLTAATNNLKTLIDMRDYITEDKATYLPKVKQLLEEKIERQKPTITC